MQALKELYYNSTRSGAKSFSTEASAVELARLLEKNRAKLLDALNDSEKEVLKKLNDTQAELDDITNYDKFTHGFKLGVLLMAEVYADAE